MQPPAVAPLPSAAPVVGAPSRVSVKAAPLSSAVSTPSPSTVPTAAAKSVGRPAGRGQSDPDAQDMSSMHTQLQALMERLASTEKNQDILRRENVRLKQELLSERSKSPPRYGRSPPLGHKEGLVPSALFQPSAPSTPMTPLTRLSTPGQRSPGHGHMRRACCTPLATAPEDGSIPFSAVPVGALVSDSRARAAHPLSRSPPRRPASVTAGRTKTSLSLLPSPSSPALRPPGTAPVAGRRPNTTNTSVVSSSANRLSDRVTSAAGTVSCTLHHFCFLSLLDFFLSTNAF